MMSEKMSKWGEGISRMFNWVIPRKFVYYFSEGSSDDVDLLGKKGANLCEMFRLGLPIPHGFIISTEASLQFHKDGGKELNHDIIVEISRAVHEIEQETGKYFGTEALRRLPKQKEKSAVPLLFSVRSDSILTAPGLMDSVLNLGMNDEIVDAMLKSSSNARWVYDTFRRFLQMFGTTIYGIEPALYENVLQSHIKKQGLKSEAHLTISDLVFIVDKFKEIQRIPTDPWEQLGLAVTKIMQSWWSEQALKYRDIHNIPDDIGAGVIIQSMVFGNRNEFSGSGVAFTRNPSTGEKGLCGEYLPNAEGEDVSHGARTPNSLYDLHREQPLVFEKLSSIAVLLEKHFKDVQTVEFTIESGLLYVLETRNSFRTAEAAAAIATSMVNEGILSEREALVRVDANHVQNYLHDSVDRVALKQAQQTSNCSVKLLGSGFPASFGAAQGCLVFDYYTASLMTTQGKDCILYTPFATFDDTFDYSILAGLVTSRGGMSSNLITVLRELGKEVIVSAHDIIFDPENKELRNLSGDVIIHETELITIDGGSGLIYVGDVPLKWRETTEDFRVLMRWADKFKSTQVFVEAHTCKQAKLGSDLGSDGLGMCRIDKILKEHPLLDQFRFFLLAKEPEQLNKVAQDMTADLEGQIFELMKVISGQGFIIQLADAAVSEFFPDPALSDYEHRLEGIASRLALSRDYCHDRLMELREVNPLLGHRGARMMLTNPRFAEMQLTPIIAAAIQGKLGDMGVNITIMIPTVFSDHEVDHLIEQFRSIKKRLCKEYDIVPKSLHVDVGVMLATPRSCLRADKLCQLGISTICFDTNMLTQLVMGISVDDSHLFMGAYLNQHIIARDPFKTLDSRSVGSLIALATMKGREINSDLRVGMYGGGHCSDPSSIKFAFREHLNFIICTPYLVPTAKISAAHAYIEELNKKQDEELNMFMNTLVAENEAF